VLYRYPATAKVDKVIAKNKFYQQGNATHRIERLFVEQVETIRWAYKLSSQTINLSDSDTVKEIQIFQIDSRVREFDTDICEFIDKAIPSPIIFEVHFSHQVKVIATYKRVNQADSQKVVLGKYYSSDWLEVNERQDLPLVFSIADLYEWLIERLLAVDLPKDLDLSPIAPQAIAQASVSHDTIADKIAYAEKVALLNKQIGVLQKRIDKEKQFNRQVEMNLQLQGLQKQLNEFLK
jgi:hypothetical protein